MEGGRGRKGGREVLGGTFHPGRRFSVFPFPLVISRLCVHQPNNSCVLLRSMKKRSEMKVRLGEHQYSNSNKYNKSNVCCILAIHLTVFATKLLASCLPTSRHHLLVARRSCKLQLVVLRKQHTCNVHFTGLRCSLPMLKRYAQSRVGCSGMTYFTPRNDLFFCEAF